MNKTEFFITLPSNSSTEYFPDNKTTRFTTQLPQNIKLDGSWQVALIEIIYPCTFYNVNDRENEVTIKNKLHSKSYIQGQKAPSSYNFVHKLKVPVKNYENTDQVLHEMNENNIINKYVAFSYIASEKRVKASFKNAEVETTSLLLSPRLALQLGYPPFEDLFEKRVSINAPNLMMGIPPQIYIYCDIIEPQIVGDVVTQLLRIVHIDTENYIFGSNKTISYNQPHFVPVLRREFTNIEIDIRCNDGFEAPFQFGTLCVKLQFQRTS